MAQFIKAVEVVKGGYVKIAPTDTQFDSTILASHCDNAEREYVRNAIGNTFFEYLKTQRTSGIINYNADLGAIVPAFTNPDLESLFLDGKLFDLIGNAVVKTALPFIHFKITSSGVQVPVASYANAGTGSDMRYLGDSMAKTLTFLTKEVQDYLCDNEAIYTPYGFDATEFCKHCKQNNKIKQTNLPIIY